MVHHKTAERIFRIATSLSPHELSLDDAMNLAKAQQLCWTAMECDDPSEAIRLAVEATKLTPLCADAFNLLAHLICYNDAERLILLRWATRVGELCCRNRIAENTGHIHGFHDARPYLRARTELAWTLRQLGCYEEAVSHYEALLSMEHQDGVALGMLMTSYLELRRFDKAKTLFDAHRENGGTFLDYSETAWCWLTGQNNELFNASLSRALDSNEYVPLLLESPDTPVEQSPFGVALGHADEAAEYLEISSRLWDAFPQLKRKVISDAKKLLPAVRSKREQRIRRMQGEL
jgi:tetratricopeptide (TPR) repeat protein